MAKESNGTMLRERATLAAVLLGQTGRPQGAPPSDAELAAWVGRRLTGIRLSEVESHIAHDPQVFARAMAAREAHRPAPTFVSRMHAALSALAARPIVTAGAFASVAAIGVLVASGLLREVNPPGAAPTPPVLRDAAAPHPDWRVVAFRAGYWQREAAVAADRAGEAPDAYGCVDEEGCGTYVRELVRFGEVLARVNDACAHGLDETHRAAFAAELTAIDGAMARSLELLSWRGRAQELSSAFESGAMDACERAEALRELLIAD